MLMLFTHFTPVTRCCPRRLLLSPATGLSVAACAGTRSIACAHLTCTVNRVMHNVRLTTFCSSSLSPSWTRLKMDGRPSLISRSDYCVWKKVKWRLHAISRYRDQIDNMTATECSLPSLYRWSWHCFRFQQSIRCSPLSRRRWEPPRQAFSGCWLATRWSTASFWCPQDVSVTLSDAP